MRQLQRLGSICTCDARWDLLHPDPELPGQRAHDAVDLVQVGDRGGADDGLDAAHARRDARLRHHLERADLRVRVSSGGYL